MKAILLILTVSLYSAIGSAQAKCSDLFKAEKGTSASKIDSSGKPLSLVAKADQVSDRLFFEFRKGKTVSEGLLWRDEASVPEFRIPLQSAVFALEKNLKIIEKDRSNPYSYYGRLSPSHFREIREIIHDQIKRGKTLLKEEKFKYKETIFYAYKTSILFLYLKSNDMEKINPEAFDAVSEVKYIDFIMAAKSYDDALNYTRLVRDEITKNFLMLNALMSDPLTVLYFMRSMPSISTINAAAPKGTIFLSVVEELANIHNQKNYPPFFLTYHDVVHAYTVMKNKNKIFDILGIKQPSIENYIVIHDEIHDFLSELYKFGSLLPENKKILFQSLYNSLTHDFVKNLYHHPVRLTKLLNNFSQFTNFRNTTIDRSLRIHQEDQGRDLKTEEIDEMEKLFDQFIVKNKGLIP